MAVCVRADGVFFLCCVECGSTFLGPNELERGTTTSNVDFALEFQSRLALPDEIPLAWRQNMRFAVQEVPD